MGADGLMRLRMIMLRSFAPYRYYCTTGTMFSSPGEGDCLCKCPGKYYLLLALAAANRAVVVLVPVPVCAER